VTRLELARPRDITALFGDSLRAYGSHFGTFFVVALAIIVPVQLIVAGIGLEQLSAPYDESPALVESLLPTVVSLLVVVPLLTAAVLQALGRIASGERPRARPALLAALEAFTSVFFAVLLASLGVALGLVLIVPGVYLIVRWYFVAQVVVAERTGTVPALRRSWELVQGNWWRTFGILVLSNLAALVPALIVTVPFEQLAARAERKLWSLTGSMLAEALTAPFTVLVATLLYYDLRARSVSGV
jgi:hypothetical protein